jgi:ADP-ribose pyrophosphatase
MQPWRHIKPAETIKVGWRTLVRKTFERPDGLEAEYVTIGAISARHGAIIALTPDNKVIVAEQFRPGPELVYQELPGGNIEEGENPQEAVMRELREETGYTSDEVEFIGITRKDAYMNATWYFYLAKNCHQVHPQELDDGEFVEVRLITIEELIESAKTSMMSDPVAVFLAHDTLKQINEEGK